MINLILFKNLKKISLLIIQTRYQNCLLGGIPSRYVDDPKEAEEAMKLDKNVIDLVERKIT